MERSTALVCAGAVAIALAMTACASILGLDDIVYRGSVDAGPRSDVRTTDAGADTATTGDGAQPPAIRGATLCDQGPTLYCEAGPEICCYMFGLDDNYCAPAGSLCQGPSSKAIRVECDDDSECTGGTVCCALKGTLGYDGISCVQPQQCAWPNSRLCSPEHPECPDAGVCQFDPETNLYRRCQ